MAYNSNAGLEKQNFEYNIRGWMLGVNRGYIKDDSTNHFGYELGYDKTTNIISGQSYAAAQYNGNITGPPLSVVFDKIRTFRMLCLVCD